MFTWLQLHFTWDGSEVRKWPRGTQFQGSRFKTTRGDREDEPNNKTSFYQIFAKNKAVRRCRPFTFTKMSVPTKRAYATASMQYLQTSNYTRFLFSYLCYCWVSSSCFSSLLASIQKCRESVLIKPRFTIEFWEEFNKSRPCPPGIALYMGGGTCLFRSNVKYYVEVETNLQTEYHK